MSFPGVQKEKVLQQNLFDLRSKSVKMKYFRLLKRPPYLHVFIWI